ncbi:putative allantoate permease [Hypoxylon trugodes]|uniref:putative allantoate permease n=1 Tax=Hypoxylon trugodes TaxID=326681 RepID=UPI0021903B13|nr:putative allantoate permease [Hypoxylon trugodes]KAI1387986.1 putative allantoate permease [Hypoxylon trugodes]
MSHSDENQLDQKQEALHDAETASHRVGDLSRLERDTDVAARFLASLDPSIINEPITKEESRRLLWKIDLIIVPLLAFSVIIAAVDKVIISNAAIYGMRKDTNLVGNQFSWVGSIFYFGFLAAEWPSNVLIQKLPLRTFYAATVLAWAALSFGTGGATSFASLASVRFLMGIFEAVVFPICTLVSTMWWTIDEQPIRVAIWFNTLSSIITGLFSYGVGHSNSNVAPWRLLFFILGAITTLWAAILYIFLPSSPVEAWWLTDRQKYVCLERVRKSNTGIEDKKMKWYQVKECLMDPRSWLISIFACAINIPNGGLVTFAAIIVNGMGFSTLDTTLLGVPTGVVGTLWSLILNITASRLPGWRCVLIVIAIMFPMASAILMWKLPSDNKLSLLGAYYAFYSYWAPYTMCTSLPMANTSGHTKKVTLNAMFFIGYCVGNILGPQVFRDDDAPEYHRGYIGLLASLIVGAVSITIYGLLCYWDNARRNKLQGGGPAPQTEEEKIREAFSDKTDKEKPNFRYTY